MALARTLMRMLYIGDASTFTGSLARAGSAILFDLC